MWGTVGNMHHRSQGGIIECKLDNRFRFAIPARLRAPFLERGAVVGWWLDGCLIACPAERWDGLVESVFGDLDVLDENSRWLSRFLLAGAVEMDLDKQGRVSLNQAQREHAGIDTELTVVGNRGYLELWNPERLDERFAAMRGGGVERYARKLADGRA